MSRTAGKGVEETQELSENPRRAAIVGACRDIIVEGGFSSVSIRKIAARAGIGMSTVFHYFRTRDELIEACAKDLVDTWNQIASGVLADDGLSPAERLARLIDVGLSQDSDGLWRMYVAFAHESVFHGAAHSVLIGGIKQWDDLVLQCVEELLADCEVVLDPEIVARSYTLLIVGAALHVQGSLDRVGPAAGRALCHAYLQRVIADVASHKGVVDLT